MRPRCAIARYVAGCYLFDHNRPAQAVRSMMIAHHAEPAYESAALLVFAGLNWIAEPQRPLLDVLLGTWDQFRRPQFSRTAAERRLLDAFAAPMPATRASELTVRLWRLPLATVRAQLSEAAREDASDAYPRLLLATA